MVGKRGTHGAILDFCKKLKAHPDYLDVLGDGRQSKPYLHVTDCAAGLLYVLDHAPGPSTSTTSRPPDSTSVARIAELCVAASPYKPSARIDYSRRHPRVEGRRADVAAHGDKLERAWIPPALHVGPGSRDVAVAEVAREVFGAH